MQRNFNSNGEILTFATTSLKLAEALRNEIPDIEYVAETDWMAPHGLMVKDKKLYMGGGIVAGDFLKMFQYPLEEGNANTVFQDAYSIVLTKSTAKALFGKENPIGQMVRFDNENNLKVTGILKDLPSNSNFRFNFLVPFSYLDQTSTRIKKMRAGSFGNNAFQLFVKLKPGINYQQASDKVKDITKTEKDNTNAMKSDVILHPIKDRHLYSEFKNGKAVGGFIEYVRMFTIIGGLVLLIACINFINLTTARSEKRAREVGVRKAIGSQRKDLIFQFLIESFIITLISSLFAFVFVQLALPAFNTLTSKTIVIPFNDGIFWMIILACVVITAILAGSRPAFYLSAFNPVKVLKGSMHRDGKTGALPRKILVVLQFSCSIALIISTVVVYKQIQHAKDRPIGYNLNRLMMTDMNSDLRRNYTAIKNELIQKGIAENVSMASSPATEIYWHSDLDHWPGKNVGETVEMGILLTGEDYFNTLRIAMKEGRSFTQASDTTTVIFNEAAIERLRLKNPLNQIVTWDETKYRIAGVAKDALMLSPFGSADPTMFVFAPAPQSFMMYRLNPGINTQEAIKKLTAIFNKYNPAYPYDYVFADADYAAKFNLEILIGKLSGLFAGLAIFISCLGLFGLAAYVAEQRTKEIGIRKVLGASVSQLWLLLSKDFILLVLISCVIATPVALFFLQNWLQKYSYRITIGAGVFILAAVMAIVITIITISFQAVKAALMNPVRSLKSD